MARECASPENACQCNFTTSSGEPVAGSGTVDDPYVFPICDDPVMIIEDCDGNQQEINCGQLLRVYPSGFNGGPIVDNPTVDNGILYIPRPKVTCSRSDAIAVVGPITDNDPVDTEFELVDLVTVDLKSPTTAMYYGTLTVCQETPAPAPLSAECMRIRLTGIASTATANVSDFIWEPPVDGESSGCQTFTFFSDIQLPVGITNLDLNVVISKIPDCPVDPNRSLTISNPQFCVYY